MVNPSRAVQTNGCQSHETSGGEQALESATARPAAFPSVSIELRLGGMAGFDDPAFFGELRADVYDQGVANKRCWNASGHCVCQYRTFGSGR
jgi:hypothetical protein